MPEATNMQTQITRRIARRSRRRAGAAIVEAAFVLPVVLLFIMGLFEYGRYYLMVHVCDNAVAAGAAYACKHTSPIVISGTTYNNGTQRRHQRRQCQSRDATTCQSDRHRLLVGRPRQRRGRQRGQ